MTSRLRAVIRIGSTKSPVVNAYEWLKPLTALTQYLASPPGGAWQSLHVAAAWWLDLRHAAKCSSITWQFAHAAGSLPRYAVPRAWTNVNIPSPIAAPRITAVAMPETNSMRLEAARGGFGRT